MLLWSIGASTASVALAAGPPGSHIAIDGLSIRLGSVDRSLDATRSGDVDALGLRLRAGIEFGGHRWRSNASDHHRADRRSRRDDERYRERFRPVPGPRLGLELHAGFGGGDSIGSTDRIDASLAGGYLTGRIPLGGYVSMKGLVGLTNVTIDRDSVPRRIARVRGGVGFGVGLEAALGRYSNLTVDWMRYLPEGEPDDDPIGRVSALAAGLTFRF